ncbi:MAG: hypothetical protein AAF389_15830 [Gemmatimonadota bacterium]
MSDSSDRTTVLIYDVFGRRLGITRECGQWVTVELGTEGKHRPARVAIPEWVEEDGLLRFLADLYHESASPEKPDVVFVGKFGESASTSDHDPS